MWLPAHRKCQRHQSQKPSQCWETVDAVCLWAQVCQRQWRGVIVNAFHLLLRVWAYTLYDYRDMCLFTLQTYSQPKTKQPRQTQRLSFLYGFLIWFFLWMWMVKPNRNIWIISVYFWLNLIYHLKKSSCCTKIASFLGLISFLLPSSVYNTLFLPALDPVCFPFVYVM